MRRSLPVFAALLWLLGSLLSWGVTGSLSRGSEARLGWVRVASAADPVKVPLQDQPASTPRRSMQAFLRASREGNYQEAARYLDLRGVPGYRQKKEGPELAAMLRRVLEWHVAKPDAELTDEPEPEGLGADGVVVTVVEVDGVTQPLAMTRVPQSSGGYLWKFSRSTVAFVRPLYEANQRRVLEEALPVWLRTQPAPWLLAWQWLGLLSLAFAAFLLGRLGGRVLVAAGSQLVRRFGLGAELLVRGMTRPLRLVVGAIGFELLCPYLLLPAPLMLAVDRGANILYILALGWTIISVVRAATTAWVSALPTDTEGQLESRGLLTRLTMVRRISTALVLLVSIGLSLLQFDVVRSIGLSLLASAGIVGVLVGFAAQKTLGGIVAGIEMSITQPVRIGDLVEFEKGEIGSVEQIYFTYLLVRLWDDRRQVVPVSRVMAAPFANWTRSGINLLAPVEIWVDHAAPVALLRSAFEKHCRESKNWDGRMCHVDVLEVGERAVRLRGMASCELATRAFALRCELRDKWLETLQQLEGGRFLPHSRLLSHAESPAVEPSQLEPAG